MSADLCVQCHLTVLPSTAFSSSQSQLSLHHFKAARVTASLKSPTSFGHPTLTFTLPPTQPSTGLSVSALVPSPPGSLPSSRQPHAKAHVQAKVTLCSLHIYEACGLGCSSVVECSLNMQEVLSPIPANTVTVKTSGTVQGVGEEKEKAHSTVSLTAGSVSVPRCCSPAVQSVSQMMIKRTQ